MQIEDERLEQLQRKAPSDAWLRKEPRRTRNGHKAAGDSGSCAGQHMVPVERTEEAKGNIVKNLKADSYPPFVGSPRKHIIQIARLPRRSQGVKCRVISC
jgi:hypothetical protein